jgi:cell division septum initiation protein DivIVA
MATPARSTSSLSSAKKQVNRAPQKRTFHFFVQVTDEAGNVIPGAKLKVDRIISDARKVIEFMDTPNYADLGLTRIKHEIVSNKRGGEDDGATSVG